jgi:transposase
MDEWVPPGHLARVVDAVVTRLDLRAVRARYHQAGAGAPPYDPALLLRVLIYGYLTQRISSRKMARACAEDLPMLWLARGERPRHSVLATFRAQCAPEIPGWMAQVVLLATELGLVGWQLGAVDGSKIHADASQHKALSYQRMQAVFRQGVFPSFSAENSPSAGGRPWGIVARGRRCAATRYGGRDGDEAGTRVAHSVSTRAAISQSVRSRGTSVVRAQVRRS